MVLKLFPKQGQRQQWNRACPPHGGRASSTGSSWSKWAGLRWSIATQCGLPHYVHNEGLTSLRLGTRKTFEFRWLSWQMNTYPAVTGPSGRGLQWQAPIDQGAAVSLNKTPPEHLHTLTWQIRPWDHLWGPNEDQAGLKNGGTSWLTKKPSWGSRLSLTVVWVVCCNNVHTQVLHGQS